MSAARDPYRDRMPPYNEAAEQAVLSAMLLAPDAILRATEHVDDTMFYREANRRVFRAMVRIFQRGEVTQQELRTLHGIVTELALGRRLRGRLEQE